MAILEPKKRYAMEPNLREALKRYLKSSKLGDSEACNCAALMLEVDNPIAAVELYKRALELNERNTQAMVNMALLYYNKREEKVWHNEALMMMRRAASYGNEVAKEYLEVRGLLRNQTERIPGDDETDFGRMDATGTNADLNAFTMNLKGT